MLVRLWKGNREVPGRGSYNVIGREGQRVGGYYRWIGIEESNILRRNSTVSKVEICDLW